MLKSRCPDGITETSAKRSNVASRDFLSQGYKVNCLSNTFKKFYGRHTDLVGQYKKNVCQMFADCTGYNDFPPEFVKAVLIKLAKMEGVMHEADHACSIRSTW